METAETWLRIYHNSLDLGGKPVPAPQIVVAIPPATVEGAAAEIPGLRGAPGGRTAEDRKGSAERLPGGEGNGGRTRG